MVVTGIIFSLLFVIVTTFSQQKTIPFVKDSHWTAFEGRYLSLVYPSDYRDASSEENKRTDLLEHLIAIKTTSNTMSTLWGYATQARTPKLEDDLFYKASIGSRGTVTETTISKNRAIIHRNKDDKRFIGFAAFTKKDNILYTFGINFAFTQYMEPTRYKLEEAEKSTETIFDYMLKSFKFK